MTNNTIQTKNTEHKKIFLYIFVSLFLVGVYLFLRQVEWVGSTQLHTAMELLATSLAIIVGLLALVRFYSKKENTFLFIGIGFLGTGFLDGYHTVVTSSFFSLFFPSPAPSLLPWSWIASRFFLSVAMFLSWWMWKREDRLGEKAIVKAKNAYLFLGLFTVLSFLFFAFVPLPRAYYPELFFGRPEEFIPAFFFLLALVGYLKKGRWKEDVFEHWVILSLIVGFIAQVLFMSFSFSLFDMEFDVAHLLKKMSYSFVLIGLLISMGDLFKKAESSRLALQGKNKALFHAKKTTEEALRKAHKSEQETEERAQSLKESKKVILNIMEDLSYEKNALANSKAKDDAILQNIGEGLVVTNLKQEIEIINPAALKMLDLDQDQALGSYWLKLVKVINEEKEEVPKKKLPIFKAAKEGQSVFENKFYYSTKKGFSFPVAITASPIILEDETIGIILVFRDITHEREVDKAKTEFVSFASHQLKTPLSTINWYTEMLLDGDAGKVSKDQKEYLKEVYSSCQRMVKLVNDILNVSRLELGTFMIQPESIKLKTIAEEALKELEVKVHEKKTKITTKYDSKIPVMNLDRKLMHMVLLNLLSNAVKYSPERGRVSLEIERKAPYALITIKDNGYGIPKEQQNKIFTKLFRADNVKAMDIEGTGFGLYIIKTIVEKAGGKIWFESEENKGTTFFVQLPLKGMAAKKGDKELS